MARPLGQTPTVSVGSYICIEVSEGEGTEECPVRRVSYYFNAHTAQPLARRDDMDEWWGRVISGNSSTLTTRPNQR